jgi:hypothetical protein
MSIRAVRNIIVLLVIVILGCLAGLYVWAMQKNEQAQQKLDNTKLELSYVEEEIAHIKKMLAHYDKEKEEFKDYLFEEQDIPAFIDQVSEYAKEARVNITDMKTQKFQRVVVPKDDFELGKRSPVDQTKVREQKEKRMPLSQVLTLSAMPIRVKVEGTFSGLAHFLNFLQDYEQLVSVSGVEISRGDYPTLDCQFVIRIYSLKTLEELGVR